MPLFRKGDEPVHGYRLEQFLGRGQFGDVWMAIAPGKLRVALKFIDLGGKQGLKEFKGVQRVREIRHPHLMSITALWLLDEDGRELSDDVIDQLEAETQGKKVDVKRTMNVRFGQPAMMVVAMPLGDVSLADVLEEKGPDAFSTEELLNYMEEAAKGIDYLNSPRHELGDGITVGIQHCDIKPANIMLMGESALVCDFGLARVLAYGGDVRATTTGMAGTPAYMAPECIEGKLPSDSTDQYSLAITYYELRTGKLPFEDDSQSSQMAILTAHVRGKLEYSRLPREEQEVIRRATSLDPAARWPSCMIMVRELRKAIEGHGHREPSLRDSDWSKSSVGGAPSGSSIFETTAETGKSKRDSKHESKRESKRESKQTPRPGSSHETLPPEEAAYLSDSMAQEREAESQDSAAAAPLRQNSRRFNETMMPADLEQPLPVSTVPLRREKDTLIEEKDTQRDSVRYDKAYVPKSQVPWGAITTTVGLIAVIVVVAINVKPDLFHMPWQSNANVDLEIGALAIAGSPPPPPAPAPAPSPAPPAPPPPSGSPPTIKPPKPLEKWEENLQSLLDKREVLQACTLFALPANDPLALPSHAQASAARQILEVWTRTESQAQPIEGDLPLATDAAKAVPSEFAELRTRVVNLVLRRAGALLEEIDLSFRAETPVPKDVLATTQSQLTTIIDDLRAIADPASRKVLADAYLLNARAKLRIDPAEAITPAQLAAAKLELESRENLINEVNLYFTVEQESIVKLLQLIPEFQSDKPLEGMQQLSSLLADPASGKLPFWERSLIDGLKQRIKSPIFAMARAGELSEVQRGLGEGLWSDLPGTDQIMLLKNHLAKQPKPEEQNAYYVRLAEIAKTYLDSAQGQVIDPNWAIAQCCLTEGRLAPRQAGAAIDWIQVNADMQRALLNVEEQHAPYGKYVAALATYLNPTSRAKETAADQITEAYAAKSELLETSFRKAIAAEVLAAAPDYLLPDDAMYLQQIVDVPQAAIESSLQKLAASRVLDPKLSAVGDMFNVILYANREASDLPSLLAAAKSAQAFDQAKDPLDIEPYAKRQTLYAQSKGKLFGRLSKLDAAAARPKHAATAISAYAAAANRLWKERQQWSGTGKKLEYATIHAQTVAPALQLDPDQKLLPANPQDKAALARLYFLRGEMIRIDPDVASNFRTPEDPRQSNAVILSCYNRARSLENRLQYYTSEGFQTMETIFGTPALVALNPIVEAAKKLDGADRDPQMLRLLAKQRLLQSRDTYDREVLAEMIDSALADLDRAMKGTDQGDLAYTSLLIDKAKAMVTKAFTLDAETEAQEKRAALEQAIALAKQAEANPYRNHPAEAFNVQGNAYEDLAFHFNDVAQYPLALEQFGKAIAADTDDGWLSLGASNMNRGRCLYRLAAHLNADENERLANGAAIEEHLKSAMVYLTEAIERNKHDNLFLSESHYWAAETAFLSYLRNPKLEQEAAEPAAEHFRRAALVAEKDNKLRWAMFQTRWANLELKRASTAFKNAYEAFKNQENEKRVAYNTKGEDHSKQARKLADEALEKCGKELTAKDFLEANRIILDLTEQFPQFAEEFRSALNRAIELSARFTEGSSGTEAPEIEAEFRLRRSEHLVTRIVPLASVAKESEWKKSKADVAADVDFLTKHHDKLPESFVKRTALLKGIQAALDIGQKPTAEQLRPAIAQLNDVIKSFKIDEQDVSKRKRELDQCLTARMQHFVLVLGLMKSGVPMAKAEKQALADEVVDHLDDYKTTKYNGNVPQEVNLYQDHINTIRTLAAG